MNPAQPTSAAPGATAARETNAVLAARHGERYRWLATATVMMGTVAAMLTTTSINVALPDIMGAFGIGQDRVQWLSTGALAAMTIGMLVNSHCTRSCPTPNAPMMSGKATLMLVVVSIAAIVPIITVAVASQR